MLTSRAWRFLSVLVILLILGVLTPQPVLTLVSLVLLCWLVWEGLLFNFRARWIAQTSCAELYKTSDCSQTLPAPG